MTAREETVPEARVRVRAEAEEGLDCPVCGRRVKVYTRKIHHEMVTFLARLQAACDRAPGFYSPRDLLPGQTKASTDAVFLVRWGFIERMPRERDEDDLDERIAQPKRGHYRITDTGRRWLRGQVLAPESVSLLCGQVVRFSDRMITAEQAYGGSFTFDDLLR